MSNWWSLSCGMRSSRCAGLRLAVFFFGGLFRVAMGGVRLFRRRLAYPFAYPARVTRPVLAALCLVMLAGAARADARRLGHGAWSWFGDPRAVSYGDSVYTGWVTGGGDVQVARWRGGRPVQVRMIKHLGRDDHNNPSLLVRGDGRITAFFSPHSGYTL